MRRRAFRPEAPAGLEVRSLLSAGPRAGDHPFTISQKRHFLILDDVDQSFGSYGKDRQLADLRSNIDDVLVLVPYAHADRVDVKVHRILNQMQVGYDAGAPHVVRWARNAVWTTINADLKARIRSGDVVIR